MTLILHTIEELRSYRRQHKNKSLGFTPTMGCLHKGHQSLFERSLLENDLSIVSSFVNPSQFNNKDDFLNYPDTKEYDLKILQDMGVDALFSPNKEELYPDDYTLQIHETELSKTMEGEFRPGHFTGMLTIVLKLLNLVQATHAYFGEKDYQQLALVKKMASALFLDVKIVACPTIREEDGLALSSRYKLLSLEQRQQASFFPLALKNAESCQKAKEFLEEKGFKVEYIEEHAGRRLAAAQLGKIRLIDNMSLAETKQKGLSL